jgi:Prokaryotic RING finger family 1
LSAGQGQIVTSALADPRAAGAVCPICQTTIGAQETSIACPACDQVHHRECWNDVGGCATYGCENAPKTEKTAVAPEPLAAWGDTKRCPACGETIKAIALRCRYCGTDFDTVDPLTLKDLRTQVVKDERLRVTKGIVITLFVSSILVACLAPLIAIAASAYVLLQHKNIAKAGPAYRVMAYSAMAVSILYSILMVLFLLAQSVSG